MSNNKKKNIEISFNKTRFKGYINTNNTMIKLDLKEIINDIFKKNFNDNEEKLINYYNKNLEKPVGFIDYTKFNEKIIFEPNSLYNWDLIFKNKTLNKDKLEEKYKKLFDKIFDNKLLILSTEYFINYFAYFFKEKCLDNLEKIIKCSIENISFLNFNIVYFVEHTNNKKNPELRTLTQYYKIIIDKFFFRLKYYYIVDINNNNIYIDYKYVKIKNNIESSINLIELNYEFNKKYNKENNIKKNFDKYFNNYYNIKLIISYIFKKEKEEKIKILTSYYNIINKINNIKNINPQNINLFNFKNIIKQNNTKINNIETGYFSIIKSIKNRYEILFFNKDFLNIFYENNKISNGLRINNENNKSSKVLTINNNNNKNKKTINKKIYNILKKLTFLRFYFNYSSDSTLAERFKQSGKKNFNYLIDYNKEFKKYLENNNINYNDCNKKYNIEIENINEYKKILNEKVNSKEIHYSNIQKILELLHNKTNNFIDYCIVIDIKNKNSINKININQNITLLK